MIDQSSFTTSYTFRAYFVRRGHSKDVTLKLIDRKMKIC